MSDADSLELSLDAIALIRVALEKVTALLGGRDEDDLANLALQIARLAAALAIGWHEACCNLLTPEEAANLSSTHEMLTNIVQRAILEV
jgi:transposase